MALMPFFDLDTMLEPFDPIMSVVDPFAVNRFNMNMPRSMKRSMRRMNREMGKLLSSIKEDDKSFQVQ
jgi:crystallin alpha B